MMIFNIFKNVIIEQNKILLKTIAEKYNLSLEDLEQKYLTKSYYLPIIQQSKSSQKN